jgi:hypothetical protein
MLYSLVLYAFVYVYCSILIYVYICVHWCFVALIRKCVFWEVNWRCFNPLYISLCYINAYNAGVCRINSQVCI